MEREIYFCRVGKGKKGDNVYYFVEYVKAGSYQIKRDYINAIQYTTLERKGKGKELQKVIGILGADEYDRLIVIDIK